jgi:hypothetical protein
MQPHHPRVLAQREDVVSVLVRLLERMLNERRWLKLKPRRSPEKCVLWLWSKVDVPDDALRSAAAAAAPSPRGPIQ